MFKWIYYLVALSGLWLLFGLSVAPTTYAASAYDGTIRYSDTLQYGENDITDSWLEYVGEKCDSGLAGIVLTRYSTPNAFLIIIQGNNGTTPATAFVDILINTDFNYTWRNNNTLSAHTTQTQTWIRISALGTCSPITQRNYHIPISTKESITPNASIFLAKGDKLDDIDYPTDYEGDPLELVIPQPPTPEPSGDGITKEEMASLLVPFAQVIGAVAAIFTIGAVYALIIRPIIRRM